MFLDRSGLACLGEQFLLPPPADEMRCPMNILKRMAKRDLLKLVACNADTLVVHSAQG